MEFSFLSTILDADVKEKKIHVSYNKALENGTVGGNTVQMSIVLPFVAICFPIKNNHPVFF